MKNVIANLLTGPGILIGSIAAFHFLLVVGTGCAVSSRSDELSTGEALKSEVDWTSFLGRHDLVWETLPQRFDHGIYHGNGLLGCMIYQDGPDKMRWEMGRSDVSEHRRDNNRLPIGGMVLQTVGKISSGTARLDLWNAESTGEILTDKGRIIFRTLIHSKEMVTLIEVTCTGEEQRAKFSWMAAPAVDAVNAAFKDPDNPPFHLESRGDISICVQPRYAGGEFATAWKEIIVNPSQGKRLLYITIADKYPDSGAANETETIVRKVAGIDLNTLLASHQQWWHAYYQKSFLSVPDMKVEGFYWAQIYKLASATRSDRQVMDLLGPWFRSTGWPRIWWNLNIQICYSPVYAANHLELGESLIRFMDAKRENFFRNAREIWKFDSCATVPHTTDYEGLRGDGSRAPDNYINPGDFTWALHNYWLQYRYSMDESMVTDQKKHAFYPLLKGSINLYLKLLIKDEVGKLHLPVMHSPEYGNAKDNNYNLSLLRWGCYTLLELNRRYNLNDPQAPEWRNVLETLTGYPQDDNGMRIGTDVAYEKSHRHWSHLLMMYPLYLINWDQTSQRELMLRSVNHWLTVGEGKGINGWSRAAASSLYASMGDGELALTNLYKHLNDNRFVMPNAMYIEGSPVIECAFVAARSLQDMILQSWGYSITPEDSKTRILDPESKGCYISTISIFPAVPADWKDLAFHDLRTEGAFLVSAVRKAGITRWIRIRSLAGEPCRIKPGMTGTVTASVEGKPVKMKELGNGIYELPLDKGQEAVLRSGYGEPFVIRPVAADMANCNAWGVKLQKDAQPDAK